MLLAILVMVMGTGCASLDEGSVGADSKDESGTGSASGSASGSGAESGTGPEDVSPTCNAYTQDLTPSLLTAAAEDADVAIGDFDGDGYEDLAVADGDAVILSTAIDDTFVEAGDVAVDSDVSAVAAMDLDGDGTDELLIGTEGALLVSWGDGALDRVGVGIDDIDFIVPTGNAVTVGSIAADQYRALDTDLQSDVSFGTLTSLLAATETCGGTYASADNYNADLSDCTQDVWGGASDQGRGAPKCSTTAPAGSGIQACIEASECRRRNCMWAICVNWYTGYYGTPGSLSANIKSLGPALACKVTGDYEKVLCVPRIR